MKGNGVHLLFLAEIHRIVLNHFGHYFEIENGLVLVSNQYLNIFMTMLHL